MTTIIRSPLPLNNSKVMIIQQGKDGFGHQLHGLFSSMILHNVKKYYFHCDAYINKQFSFQHIDINEQKIMKEYLITSVRLFKDYLKQNKLQHSNIIHIHEVNKIPDTFDTQCIYSLDNAYYFDKIPNLSTEDKNIHQQMIEVVKPFFINKVLPACRLKNKSIVLHVRQGDALTTGRGDSIAQYNKQLIFLLKKFNKEFPGYHYYIHSDGEVDFILKVLKDLKNDYTFFPKSTPLIQMVSDLIHASILVTGNSGLSKVCSFLGNKELIITSDDNKHSMPQKTQFISKYLQ